MRRCFLSVIILLMMSVSALASTPSERLMRLLGAYHTYQANFSQMTYSANEKTSQMTRGRVMLMRPGRFRWEINTPTKQVIIANGKQLWIYDVDLQQATHQILKKTQTNPAALLTGNVKQVDQQFTIRTVRHQSAKWYLLKPKNPKSAFIQVQMRFNKNRLVAMWVKNNLGQRTRFSFYNVLLNKPLKASLFQFSPPPGVDVLKS